MKKSQTHFTSHSLDRLDSNEGGDGDERKLDAVFYPNNLFHDY